MGRAVPAGALLACVLVSSIAACDQTESVTVIVTVSPTVFDVGPSGQIRFDVAVTNPSDEDFRATDRVTIRLERAEDLSTINLFGGDPPAERAARSLEYSPSAPDATDTHFIELSCSESAGTFDVVVVYSFFDADGPDSTTTQVMEYDCQEDETDPPPASSFVATLTEVFTEGPLGGEDERRIVLLPTISEGITAYRLQESDGSNPSLWISEDGTTTEITPEAGASIRNLSLMTRPFVGNEDLSCGNGSFWAFAGNITDGEGENPTERLYKSGGSGAPPIQIASTGTPALGATGPDPVFNDFRNPVVDDCGDVVFQATLSGTPAGISVWRQTVTGLTKLVQEGDPLPAAPDAWSLLLGSVRFEYLPTAASTFVFIDNVIDEGGDRHTGIWEINNLGEATCRAYRDGDGVGCEKFVLGTLYEPSVASGALVFAYENDTQLTYVIRRTTEEELRPFGQGPGGDGTDNGLGIGFASTRPLACPINGEAYFTASFVETIEDSPTAGVFRYTNGEVRTLGRADTLPGVDTSVFAPFDQAEIGAEHAVPDRAPGGRWFSPGTMGH